MTQEDLANAAHVVGSTISRLEQGRTRFPREDEFARIAAALHVTPEQLLAAGVLGEDAAQVLPDEQEAMLTRLRIATDYLRQTAEVEEHDRAFILQSIERLVESLDIYHARERRGRREE